MTMTAGLVIAVAPVASAADSITDLGVSVGITAPSDVVAGGGKVFVTAEDRIVVTDTDGALIGAVTDLPGVAGLAAAPDGTHVFAALHDSHEVVEIDTATLVVTRRIDFAAYPCPTKLALSGEVLWTAYGCDPDTGGVASLDVSASAPQPVSLVTGRPTAPLIAIAGNTLVLGDPRHDLADVLVYDVSNGSATLRGEIDGDTYGLPSPRDLAITPDGSTAVLAFSNGYEAWDTTSLTKVREYGKDASAKGQVVGVAVSPDGTHIAGGWWLGDRGIELYDVATRATTYTKKIPSGWPTPRILGGSITIAGNDVFSVLLNPSTGRLRLWRLEDATLLPSNVTLTAPERGTALEPLTLTGRLTVPDGATQGRQRLEVTRRLPDGTSATLRRARTAADGTFTITDAPPVSGTVAYDVSWGGSTDVRGSTASVSVKVVQQSASLTLTGPTDGVVGKRLRFAGELKFGDKAPTTRPSVTVIRASPDGVSTELGTVRVSRSGSFRFQDRPDQQGIYIYTVDWMGDDAASGAENAQFVTVRSSNG
ncbi:hypothetical protein [Nonomuraea guangzhouensis]|uniref:Ig-like domain repeat protein n=1 Tax=Nonomuraea guangzhouensis TaxID=1291555 RepID=A0ABW4G9R1_9ACTN|nr:hypothetical protein [Nonomuraea guangzhouensis]